MPKYRCPYCKNTVEGDLQGDPQQSIVCPHCGQRLRMQQRTDAPLPQEGTQNPEMVAPPLRCTSPVRLPSGTPRLLWIVLPVLALGISIAALANSLLRSNSIPGRGLSAYDFSTPQQAAKSQMEIEASGDVLADLELHVSKAKAEKDRIQSRISSLAFEKTVEHDGKVLLLYKYQDGGLERRKAEWFEKKGDRFYQAYVATYSWTRLGGDKAKIAKMISDWEGNELPDIP